jgi:hypothetical protein
MSDNNDDPITQFIAAKIDEIMALERALRKSEDQTREARHQLRVCQTEREHWRARALRAESA